MWPSTSLFSSSALLLVLRHFCYVGRHVSVQCFGTPASATTLLLRGQAHLCSVLRHSYECYDTYITWTSMSLFSATILLLVLRHFCYMGGYVSICASAPLFSIVSYLRVPIVLCPSHLLLMVYTDKHLYDKNLNNEQ